MATRDHNDNPVADERANYDPATDARMDYIDELMRCILFLRSMAEDANIPAHAKPGIRSKIEEIEESLGLEPTETPIEFDYRTLEEKLGPEFEERLSTVILDAYNNAAIDTVKHAPYGCAEEEAEKLRMCVAEMMGFRL